MTRFLAITCFLVVSTGLSAENVKIPSHREGATLREARADPRAAREIAATNYNLCPETDCAPGGGGGTGCADCARDGNSNSAYCEWPGEDWADCRGGSMCWYMPGSGYVCVPYCGERRCYHV